jgi:hypothetical protein
MAATWKKIIVSGSNADLNQITASGGINATLPSSQQSNFVSYNSSSGQLGFFSTGSLTAATASYVTSSNVYGPYGANSILSASYATTASFVTQAVSASFATTASYVKNAQTASYVLQAVSASYASSSTSASYSNNSTSASFAQTASYVLQAVSASYASSSTSASYSNNSTSASFATTASYVNGNIFTSTNPATSASYALSSSFASTSPAGNLTGATLASNVLSSSLTSLGIISSLNATNAVITNNLTVQGTASFQNTENLLVADRFVLFASGSTSAGDGGIVVQQGTQNVGELYGYESTINRWGFTSSFNAGTSSFIPSAFITTTEVGASPPAAPIYGGSVNGAGNIYVTTAGDIYIYVV